MFEWVLISTFNFIHESNNLVNKLTLTLNLPHINTNLYTFCTHHIDKRCYIWNETKNLLNPKNLYWNKIKMKAFWTKIVSCLYMIELLLIILLLQLLLILLLVLVTWYMKFFILYHIIFLANWNWWILVNSSSSSSSSSSSNSSCCIINNKYLLPSCFLIIKIKK